MKKKHTLTLSLLLACATLGAGLSSPSADGSDVAAFEVNSFPREPVIVYTSGRLTTSGYESTSLVVYQDGFVTASRTTPGAAPVQLTVNVGPLKVRGWYLYLLSVGAGRLEDGPTPDPTGVGAATLTVLEAATNSRSHTFSFGPGDYPALEGGIAAIFTRLNV